MLRAPPSCPVACLQGPAPRAVHLLRGLLLQRGHRPAGGGGAAAHRRPLQRRAPPAGARRRGLQPRHGRAVDAVRVRAYHEAGGFQAQRHGVRGLGPAVRRAQQRCAAGSCRRRRAERGRACACSVVRAMLRAGSACTVVRGGVRQCVAVYGACGAAAQRCRVWAARAARATAACGVTPACLPPWTVCVLQSSG